MNESFSFNEHTHRRLNILTGEWILVSPHRMKRPWQGKLETLPREDRPEYDAKCYLCPTNERANNAGVNPDYPNTFVFENDFGAIVADIPAGTQTDSDLLIAQSERGICKVICYSPKHNLTMGKMSETELLAVVNLWADEYEKIGKEDFINYVQIFENKGSIMGCSNPHPHGQIWAQEHLPTEIVKECRKQEEYYDKHGHTLLTDYLALELRNDKRVICENDSFAVVVPFWAVWPYETLLISKRPVSNILEMNEQERADLGRILQKITATYDKVFKCSFPYSMGLHQAPTDGLSHPEWHFHIHFYPPLLRSATVKKFMVGYEMMAEPQRDISAERVADTLKNLCL